MLVNVRVVGRISQRPKMPVEKPMMRREEEGWNVVQMILVPG